MGQDNPSMMFVFSFIQGTKMSLETELYVGPGGGLILKDGLDASGRRAKVSLLFSPFQIHTWIP